MRKISVKVKNKTQMRLLLEFFASEKIGAWWCEGRTIVPSCSTSFLYPTEIFTNPEKRTWDFGEVGEMISFDEFARENGIEVVKKPNKPKKYD